MPVLVRVAHAHHAALGEPHAARTLDLQEEGFDRIVDVDELLALDRRLAVLDVRARPVGNHAPAFDAAAQPLVLELRIELGQVDGQQVVGRRVQRDAVARRARATAGQQRLVVAGDHSGVAAIRRNDLVGAKMTLEEGTHRVAIRGDDGTRVGAGGLPEVAGRRRCEQRRAAHAEGRPDFGDPVLGPAGQRAPRDRQVLRRQRRCGGRRRRRSDGGGAATGGLAIAGGAAGSRGAVAQPATISSAAAAASAHGE